MRNPAQHCRLGLFQDSAFAGDLEDSKSTWAKQCRLGLFEDSDFAGDLEDSKSTSGGTLCIFGSRTFVPTSWMCKKQTSASHCSTESEFISLVAGLRMDSIPALDLWDLVIEVLRSSKKTDQFGETRGETRSKGNTPTQRRRNTSTEMMLNYSMWVTLSATKKNLVGILKVRGLSMIFFLFLLHKEFSLTGNGDSLVSDGRCRHFLARCSGCNVLCTVSKGVIFTSACHVSHLA